ncbi:hypothetical protein Esi_0376_0006 [Ectocarpus siliculosus]|uniref:Uncharacterized protein n=1 Tax=Ectocarpus siliculosus TaxID=2880 RepID=D7FZK0_ECTSI|nr:hypothetical protein Esi_0376_0006 [Ectocarpus siliculosus]|eukprot:CBJ32807.1 hypothetical protein Esi_0376_0006 [Ectocarpus siliculosus]
MGLAVPTRPVLRRVSSAVLAGEAAAGRNGGGGGGGGSAMMEQRRLVSPSAAACNDGQQRSSAVALEAVATLRPALTQAFTQQDLAEREARTAACAKLPRGDGRMTAAAARVDDKGTRDPWVWEASPRPLPPPEPRPGPTETPAVVVACEGEEGVGNVTALVSRESKPERGCRKSVLEEEGGGSVPMPAMSVAEKLKQARQMPEATGTFLPTQRGRTATGGAPAVAKEAELVLTATAAADATAAVEISAEKTPAKSGQVKQETAKSSEVDSKVEHKSSMFSRFSSVFSRRRHPPTVAENDGTGPGGEAPAVPVATVKESRRGEEPAPPARESNVEAKEQPPVLATSAKAEATREPSEDRQPASPATGRRKPGEEGPPSGGGCGEETTVFVPPPDEGERPETAATATAADLPFSGSNSPAPSSKSSPLSAERADAPQDSGPMGSGIQVGQVAASPGREQPELTPPRHRSRFSSPPAIITDPARKNGPIGLTSNGSKEVMASPDPPRSALTPPGYRCRLAAKPVAGRVVSPLPQGASPQTGVEERKATMPPRRAGLTPPGYRSRSYSSSPSARRRASSPGQGSIAMAGEEGAREPSSSARPRRTGLTPPGYRSRPSPPLAGRVDSRRRESAPAVSPGVRSVLGASDAGGHVTPGRDKAKAPAFEQRTGILEGTPTRRRAYSSPGLYSPGKGLRSPGKMRQERLGGGDGVGEEAEKVVERETSPGSLPEPSSPTQQQPERPVGDKEAQAPPKENEQNLPEVSQTPPMAGEGVKKEEKEPEAVQAPPKADEGKGEEELPETFPCSPNFAAGFVAGRRKRRAVSGVPVVTAAAAALSPVVSAERRRASSGSKAPESSEQQESGLGESSGAESSGDESGSSWETCSSSEEEEEGGCGVVVEEEGEEGEGWGRLSYLDEIDEHPYGGVVVIDPDLVRSGGSSNGGGSARSSIPRSSVDDEARSGGRRSWTASPPTAEMSTQTTQGEEGVAHVLVQAGDGKLLSEAELREEYTQRELRERLEMMNHDLLAEVFHREIVKQEEAQKRRKQLEAHEAEVLALRDELHAVQMSHNNEKIKMRWEHADELARVEAEGGDVVGMRQELEEERRLREEDEKRHEAALQKERQHRREWEARSDEHARDKREQAKQHREEMRRQVAAERKRAEGEARKKLEARHKEAQQKAEEVVKMQLKMIKEMDQENDELREENAELREKLGIEDGDDDEEEEEEGTEAG